MTRQSRNKFTQQQKDQAIDNYISGDKTAKEIAAELGTETHNIYRWKSKREEEKKGLRLNELMDQGNSRDMAKKLLEKELEIAAYQKKVAEQAVMIDLLKKSRIEGNSQAESELIGLMKTIEKSGRKNKRVKR